MQPDGWGVLHKQIRSRGCRLNRGFLIASCKMDEDNPSVMAGVDYHSDSTFNLTSQRCWDGVNGGPNILRL